MCRNPLTRLAVVLTAALVAAPAALTQDGTPPLLKAPFTAAEATAARAAWAKYLGRPEIREVRLKYGATLRLVLVPPGEFTMGAPKSEDDAGDETPYRVSVTKPFYIGETEVTQEHWFAVRRVNPSRFDSRVSRAIVADENTDDFPVEQVSWDDCKEFCRQAGGGLRLPTEAEWEYACRAGTESAFSVGGELTARQANIGYELLRTRRVQSYAANAFGLWDMHGNVWEWCEDRYAPYNRQRRRNPHGDDRESNPLRVVRGGSWVSRADYCRSAFRDWSTPDVRLDYIGFRVAATCSFD